VSYLRSLPANATLPDVFRAFPETSRPLLAFHQALLRGPSPLAVEERETIAGFVSGLNACRYCYGVHEATAREFGLKPGMLAALLDDLATAPVDDRLKPVLAYVRKLTLAPAKVTQADVDSVYMAGGNERALHDVVAVCALFNLMNRLVEGLGISAGSEYFEAASRRLHAHGYAGLLSRLD
jgi:uncharacterized peroxidase-related enzyme